MILSPRFISAQLKLGKVTFMATQKQVGKGFDGSLRLTLSVVLGLILVIAGVVIIVYLGSFVFGVPVLMLGLISPILLQLVLGSKQT